MKSDQLSVLEKSEGAYRGGTLHAYAKSARGMFRKRAHSSGYDLPVGFERMSARSQPGGSIAPVSI